MLFVLGDRVGCLKGEAGGHMTRSRRKNKLSPFTAVGVLVLCGVICGTMVVKTVSLKAESAKYSAQISELERQQKELEDEKAEIEDYKSYVSSQEYTEQIAREKLGLVYPNEIIFEPDDE
jgi:cell division protein DivIC